MTVELPVIRHNLMLWVETYKLALSFWLTVIFFSGAPSCLLSKCVARGVVILDTVQLPFLHLMDTKWVCKVCPNSLMAWFWQFPFFWFLPHLLTPENESRDKNLLLARNCIPHLCSSKDIPRVSGTQSFTVVFKLQVGNSCLFVQMSFSWLQIKAQPFLD